MQLMFFRGRFSIVKLCVQHDSGEEVAVKLLSKKLSDRDSVETEFNTLQSLQHQHLPMVFDTYNIAGYYAIVLEL